MAFEIACSQEFIGANRRLKPGCIAILLDERTGAGPYMALRRQGHLCARQYFCHKAAHPPLIMLHDISPDCGERQKAAVRLPPAPPSDIQFMRGPSTRICPSRETPVGRPIRATKASRAATGSASGQGWPTLHDPSISLAAMPESRTCGPSAHQTGPSPSQTRMGVHGKD